VYNMDIIIPAGVAIQLKAKLQEGKDETMET
jgi:hypothetical protein